MSSPLNIVISSGGTAVPIDDIRILTNHSKGTTGALIAEEALRRGHSIDFVHSINSKLPFHDALTANPHADIEKEMKRIREGMEMVKELIPRITYHPVKDFFDYQKKLLQLVKRETTDVVILSMAASDYGPEKTEGKISSDGSGLTLHLKPLPKIITQVKQTRENIFLVGFKLLAEESGKDELFEKAFSSMERDGQDLAVANLVDPKFSPVSTYLLHKNGDVTEIRERKDLPRILLEQIERDVHKK